MKNDPFLQAVQDAKTLCSHIYDLGHVRLASEQRYMCAPIETDCCFRSFVTKELLTAKALV